MTWSRREMLIAAALVPVLYGRRSVGAFDQAQVAFLEPQCEIGDLFSILGDLQSAAAIGKAALRQYPKLRNEEQLTSDLQTTMCELVKNGAMVSVSSIEPPEIWRYLKSAVSADFANGQMTNVDGWLLADTEVKLCVLAALRS